MIWARGQYRGHVHFSGTRPPGARLAVPDEGMDFRSLTIIATTFVPVHPSGSVAARPPLRHWLHPPTFTSAPEGGGIAWQDRRPFGIATSIATNSTPTMGSRRRTLKSDDRDARSCKFPSDFERIVPNNEEPVGPDRNRGGSEPGLLSPPSSMTAPMCTASTWPPVPPEFSLAAARPARRRPSSRWPPSSLSTEESRSGPSNRLQEIPRTRSTAGCKVDLGRVGHFRPAGPSGSRIQSSLRLPLGTHLDFEYRPRNR